MRRLWRRCPIVFSSMDEAQKRKLIDDAVKASEKAASARATADSLSAARRAAIKSAMDAGVPRQELADALNVRRETLYEIAKY